MVTWDTCRKTLFLASNCRTREAEHEVLVLGCIHVGAQLAGDGPEGPPDVVEDRRIAGAEMQKANPKIDLGACSEWRARSDSNARPSGS